MTGFATAAVNVSFTLATFELSSTSILNLIRVPAGNR